jgi:hypothetical protein
MTVYRVGGKDERTVGKGVLNDRTATYKSRHLTNKRRGEE